MNRGDKLFLLALVCGSTISGIYLIGLYRGMTLTHAEFKGRLENQNTTMIEVEIDSPSIIIVINDANEFLSLAENKTVYYNSNLNNFYIFDDNLLIAYKYFTGWIWRLW